jgi:uncharacterized protein YkwD
LTASGRYAPRHVRLSDIAEGQRTPADVMTTWMNSSGHRANILDCGFRNIGVGLAYDSKHTPYWTQDFGTPL